MAVPASFDESNSHLGKPPDWDDEGDECSALSILSTETPRGTPVIYSCWKLTQEDLDEVNKTGRIWLGIAGRLMPPVLLSGTKPFEPIKEPTQ